MAELEPRTRLGRPQGGKHEPQAPGLPGLGAAGAWVRLHPVRGPERPRCFHLGVVRPLHKAASAAKRQGSRKSHKGQRRDKGQGQEGWKRERPVRASGCSPLLVAFGPESCFAVGPQSVSCVVLS